LLELFHKRTSGTVFTEGLAPFPFCQREGVAQPDQSNPRPFKVNVTAVQHPLSAGVYRGAEVRVTPVGGTGRAVTFTIAPTERVEWCGTGISVLIEIRSLTAVDALVTGAVMWSTGGPATPNRRPVTRLQRSTTLSLAQAGADGAITQPAVAIEMQNDARALQFLAGPLTGGGAMVPVAVYVYGQTAIPDAAGAFHLVELTPAGGLVVGAGAPGGSAFARVPLVPGAFDQTLYQVVGFPGVGGGATELQVWEEVV